MARKEPRAARTTPERAVTQAPRLARSKRRLSAADQLVVDEQVKTLLANPLAGKPKLGALKGVRVVKFPLGTQQALLAYQFEPRRNVIEVLDVGRHENFYLDLQR